MGLDVKQFTIDFNGKAKTLFEEDVHFARQNGVRGFPTLFFIDATGQKEIVYGSKPYALYESAILKLHSKATKSEYYKNWEVLFQNILL